MPTEFNNTRKCDRFAMPDASGRADMQFVGGADVPAKLRVLSLFAGIGGFDLGLERTGGFQTVAFCEINEFCQRVLAKHWPKVPCYDDIRRLDADTLARDGIGIDVICGGFPCQDVSTANHSGKGLDGEKSGLWREYARLIGELRPSFVIVENVAALLGRGMGQVLGDLSAIGYDAEWEVVSASDVGAPHDRQRVWLVAYPATQRRERVLRNWTWRSAEARDEWPAAPLDSHRSALAWLEPTLARISPVLRDDDGLPGRLAQQQLGALGNAVVPQIPELIGRAILQARAAA
jgi:DNA (cytosine-5)-methyltransferase 1